MSPYLKTDVSGVAFFHEGAFCYLSREGDTFSETIYRFQDPPEDLRDVDKDMIHFVHVDYVGWDSYNDREWLLIDIMASMQGYSMNTGKATPTKMIEEGVMNEMLNRVLSVEFS